jgi:hypothetical protein
MQDSVQPQPNDPRGAEIRAFVREQKSPLDFVLGRIRVGDLRTIAAVLNGEDYLSGLTLQTRDTILQESRRSFAPKEHGLYGDIDVAIRRLENAAASFRHGLYPIIEQWAAESDDAKIARTFNAT